MKKKIIKGRMATPTLVVSAKDYNKLAYEGVTKYVVHGVRRGMKIVPDVAQEIGENEVIFPQGPKQIIFRKRFSRKKVTRDVRFITADNSNRFDLVFNINLRPMN